MPQALWRSLVRTIARGVNHTANHMQLSPNTKGCSFLRNHGSSSLVPEQSRLVVCLGRSTSQRAVSVQATTQAAKQNDVEKVILPLFARRRLERCVTPHTFPIKGVTFDDRQTLVKNLRPNQRVLLTREPWSEVDPNAVAVRTLDGGMLGFVPKEETQQYALHEEQFGLVLSMGPAGDKGFFGARVRSRPRLGALTLDPLPTSYADRAPLLAGTGFGVSGSGAAGDATTSGSGATIRISNDGDVSFGSGGLDLGLGSSLKEAREVVSEQLRAVLGGARGGTWEAAAAAALSTATACEVTGVQLGSDCGGLAVAPVWRYNPVAKAMQLTRFAAVCGPVLALKLAPLSCYHVQVEPGASSQPSDNQAQAQPQQQQQSQQQQAQLPIEALMLQDINAFSTTDLQQYIQYIEARRQRMEREGWRVEALE